MTFILSYNQHEHHWKASTSSTLHVNAMSLRIYAISISDIVYLELSTRLTTILTVPGGPYDRSSCLAGNNKLGFDLQLTTRDHMDCLLAKPTCPPALSPAPYNCHFGGTHALKRSRTAMISVYHFYSYLKKQIWHVRRLVPYI